MGRDQARREFLRRCEENLAKLRRYQAGEPYEDTLKGAMLKGFFLEEEDEQAALAAREEHRRAKNRKFQKDWRQRKPYKSVFNDRRAAAARRGIDWSLDFEECKQFWQQPCYYCGDSTTLNLDRIDNTQGYHVDNVRPCCAVCNKMKSSTTHEDFIVKVRAIAKLHPEE